MEQNYDNNISEDENITKMELKLKTLISSMEEMECNLERIEDAKDSLITRFNNETDDEQREELRSIIVKCTLIYLESIETRCNLHLE